MRDNIFIDNIPIYVYKLNKELCGKYIGITEATKKLGLGKGENITDCNKKNKISPRTTFSRVLKERVFLRSKLI